MLSTLKTTHVRSQIEPHLKDRATAVLAKCGLKLIDAIRLFLRQVVVQQKLPFAIRTPNATTKAAMKQSRSIRKAKFANGQEILDDLQKASAGKARKPAKKQR